MKNVPFFSIIIPVYNVEAYLKTCFESIINQSYKDYEVIFIDDGSTDNSGEICEFYWKSNPDIVKVIHQKNGGLSKARNTGIFSARGLYIIFLDSDDFFFDNYALEKIRSKITDQDVVAFEWKKFIDGQDKFIPDIHYPKSLSTGIFTGKEFLDEMLKRYPGMPWYSCMYAYKYAYIQEHNLRFEEGHTYEDVLMTPKAILMADTVSVLSYPIYAYRINRAGSITATANYKNLNDHLYASFYNVDLVNSIKDMPSSLKEKMLSNFAEEYFSVMINVYALPIKLEQKKIIDQLNHHRQIAQYAQGRKQVIARWIMDTFGIIPAICLLNMRRIVKRMLK